MGDDRTTSSFADIAAVTLDVGNTLLFVEPSVGAVYSAIAAGYGIALDPCEAERRFAVSWRDTESRQTGLVYGTTHEEALDFWFTVVRQCFEPDAVDDGTARELCTDLYDVFGQAKVWRTNPGWPSVRDHCRRVGLRLAFVSNWDLRLRPLLGELGLAEQVDSIVISAEHGLEKPDAGIFRVACRELDVSPEYVLHVGDTWDADVQAARRLGMQAAWLNPAGVPSPDPSLDVHELSDLAEVVSLLS